MRSFTRISVLILILAGAASAADFPQPIQGDFVIRDFQFRCGQTLREVRIHYRTLGRLRVDGAGRAINAVLILHGTTGSGEQFFHAEFAGQLFNRGQLLDADKYFLIFPDDIGHGQSSKPSDGLRASFPPYRYEDMVQAEHRLVTEGLKVNHLRLVMGTSMGGMHTWMWGEEFPDFVDALMPLASLPAPVSGRNRMWRRMISEMIRTDPQWQGGNYVSQPTSLKLVEEVLYFMSGNPVMRYHEAPTGQAADKLLDDSAAAAAKRADANDVLYAVESSADYDPSAKLEAITAPLIAVNSADDLINPPDLGILQTQIKRVKRGNAIVIPESSQTVGHGTHSLAVLWKQYLAELLAESEK